MCQYAFSKITPYMQRPRRASHINLKILFMCCVLLVDNFARGLGHAAHGIEEFGGPVLAIAEQVEFTAHLVPCGP